MIQRVARGAPNTCLDVAREGPPPAEARNEPVTRDPSGAVPAEGVAVDRIGPDGDPPNPNLVSPPERRVTISAEPEIILVPNPIVSEPANVSLAASVAPERSRQASVSSVEEPGAEPTRASPVRSRASSAVSNTSVSASEALRRQLLDDVPLGIRTSSAPTGIPAALRPPIVGASSSSSAAHSHPPHAMPAPLPLPLLPSGAAGDSISLMRPAPTADRTDVRNVRQRVSEIGQTVARLAEAGDRDHPPPAPIPGPLDGLEDACMHTWESNLSNYESTLGGWFDTTLWSGTCETYLNRDQDILAHPSDRPTAILHIVTRLLPPPRCVLRISLLISARTLGPPV